MVWIHLERLAGKEAIVQITSCGVSHSGQTDIWILQRLRLIGLISDRGPKLV